MSECEFCGNVANYHEGFGCCVCENCASNWTDEDIANLAHMHQSAEQILVTAQVHMEERASTYDRGGERSIPLVVDAFNAITSHSLSHEQGWLFQVLLKAVRTQQGDFKMDSYEDMSAYAALMGEQASMDRG